MTWTAELTKDGRRIPTSKRDPKGLTTQIWCELHEYKNITADEGKSEKLTKLI